jgi:hypothetical protein
MDAAPEFPPGADGDAFRRLVAAGDDLTQTRVVDFCFVFPDRARALAFAGIVDGRDSNVCISYYIERSMWQVAVQQLMVPSYSSVRETESVLTRKATTMGGEADGWGCMAMPRK